MGVRAWHPDGLDQIEGKRTRGREVKLKGLKKKRADERDYGIKSTAIPAKKPASPVVGPFRHCVRVLLRHVKIEDKNIPKAIQLLEELKLKPDSLLKRIQDPIIRKGLIGRLTQKGLTLRPGRTN